MEFNFKNLTDKEKQEFAELLFAPLNTVEELRDWIMTFLSMDMPLGSVDPESTSSPIHAIWQVYETFKFNKGNKNPGYIMLSCRAGYKCQAKGSKLLTPSGLINIENVKVGDTVWSGFNWQKVTNHIDDGFKDGIKIKVKGGLEFVGSPIHRYWTLRNGIPQWVESKDLDEKTDLICINTDTGLLNEAANKENFQIGYFLGLLAGDGGVSSINSKTHAHFGLTTTDPYIKDFFYYFVDSHFKSKISIQPDGISYCVWNKQAISKIESWGVKAARSWEKEIPSFCYENLDAMKGFIAGLFDTDGSFSKEGDILISITADLLLTDLQKVLLSFGVWSNLRSNKKLYSNQKHLVHSLTINRNESNKLSALGVKLSAKKANEIGKETLFDTVDSIPMEQISKFLQICKKYSFIQIRDRERIKPVVRSIYPTITIEKVKSLCDWMEENYKKTNVVSPEDLEEISRVRNLFKNKWKPFAKESVASVHFYDLTVENDHSYWSNGSISHNTVSVAVLEILLVLHFGLTIAHMAAIEPQSAVCLKYIEGFFFKIQPLIEAAGWAKTTSNKRTVEFTTPSGDTAFIKVIIATPQGANSLHTNVLVLDELDLADEAAVEESKFVPVYAKGIHPVKIVLSTRKYAFGLMTKEIDRAPETGYKILRWNVIDVTEYCGPDRHLPLEPKVERYIATSLPLKQLTTQEFDLLSEGEKNKYALMKDVHAGCAKCPLLPVCKMTLSTRSPADVGGFFKPIDSTIQQFRDSEPDIAEAQLLCWRPGSEGLVYPRFSSAEGDNVITIQQAYDTLMGKTNFKIPEAILIQALKDAGVRFHAGVDWGYDHDFVIVVCAVIPNGEIWIIDCYASPGLEFSEQLEIAKGFRDKYDVDKWYADTAMPANIKSFRKNGMKCVKFTKDVLGGIEALRSKITDAFGKRNFKIVRTESTKKVISAVSRHRFKLDGQGNATTTPQDERGIADICDTLRYMAQNLFPLKGPHKVSAVFSEQRRNGANTNLVGEQLRNEIYNRVDTITEPTKSGKKGGFHFSF